MTCYVLFVILSLSPRCDSISHTQVNPIDLLHLHLYICIFNGEKIPFMNLLLVNRISYIYPSSAHLFAWFFSFCCSIIIADPDICVFSSCCCFSLFVCVVSVLVSICIYVHIGIFFLFHFSNFYSTF